MRAFILSLVTLGVFTFNSVSAEARPVKSRPSTTTAADYRSPAAEGPNRFGLGFATYGGGQTGPTSFLTPSISGWLDLSALMSIQAAFGVVSSSPFNFGFTGAFRYTLHGSQADGFHAGVGFTLGTTGAVAGASTFFLNLFPLIGYHFALGSTLSNLQLSFDGGPIFAVTPSPFQFEFQPISPLMGASLHYFF